MDRLNLDLHRPSAQELARTIAQEIRMGNIPIGTKLPAIRNVAKELGIAPATVQSAWSSLARFGIVHANGRKGTTVINPHAGLSRYKWVTGHTNHFPRDLSTGTPDPALLPKLKDVITDEVFNQPISGYLAPPILPELHDYLHRNWPYKADAFTVTDGAMDALELANQTHIRFGDRVIVEDPTFPMIVDALESRGAEIIGVPSDREGMLPRYLEEALTKPTAAIYLQPRAQNPTGISMSPARAKQLAAILQKTDIVVIEDDSIGAISSTPAISLGSYIPQQVIHIRSFSKAYGPDLRLAAVSGSTTTIEAMIARRQLGQGWSSRILQRLLLNLVTSKAIADFIGRARTIYQRRREAMLRALESHGIMVNNTDGFNLWIPVENETSASVYLAQRGIGVAPGSAFLLADGPSKRLRVTISTVQEQEAAELARHIATATTLHYVGTRR